MYTTVLCVFACAGIGVPIMLAYVYGVVPISLCRSGGCGVSAGNGKGVRIEFDDENDMNVGGGAAATGECPSAGSVLSISTSSCTERGRVVPDPPQFRVLYWDGCFNNVA